MSDTTRKQRGLRRAVIALAGLALLIAATAGLGTGSAAAHPHHSAHQSRFGESPFGGQGWGHPPKHND